MAIAFAVSMAIPDRFTSTATLDAGGADSETAGTQIWNQMTRTRLLELIDKHRVYAADRARLPDEELIQRMMQNIKVTWLNDTNGGKSGFRVAFTGLDPTVANRVTAGLAASLIEGGSFSLVDSASESGEPVYPNRLSIAFMGLAAGALLGGFWTLLRGRKAYSSVKTNEG